jgi:hypothetical protein
MSDATSPTFEIDSSRHFATWMAETGVSIGFTTYQIGKVFLIGVQPNGRLAV